MVWVSSAMLFLYQRTCTLSCHLVILFIMTIIPPHLWPGSGCHHALQHGPHARPALHQPPHRAHLGRVQHVQADLQIQRGGEYSMMASLVLTWLVAGWPTPFLAVQV